MCIWVRFNLALACAIPFFFFFFEKKIRSFNFHLFFISIYVITLFFCLFVVSLFVCCFVFRTSLCSSFSVFLVFWNGFACTRVMFNFPSIIDIFANNQFMSHSNWQNKENHVTIVKPNGATETEESKRKISHEHCAQFKLALLVVALCSPNRALILELRDYPFRTRLTRVETDFFFSFCFVTACIWPNRNTVIYPFLSFKYIINTSQTST